MTKRIALIIGIDQYNCEEIVGLKGAIRDARQLSAYLEYGLPVGERFEVFFLSNATHERVIETLEKIRLALQGEEDVVFALYFSGYGKRFHDGASQLLLCADATRTTLLGRTTVGAITPEELAYYKDEIPGHKFFCFDSCRSQLDRAHGDDLDENGTSLFRDVVCRRSEAAQAKFYCHWSLSSCADRERASDDGAFMNAMLETMKSSMDACGRILLDDSFVRAITDRIHLSNPDSYQHPVGGGNSFCLCGTEVETISDDEFRKYAEELAQDSKQKVGKEQDVKAKQNADRGVVQIKMEEANTLAVQGKYAEAIGKIDDALRIMPDGEVGELLRKTRGNYVQAAKALDEKAAAEKKAKELEEKRKATKENKTSDVHPSALDAVVEEALERRKKAVSRRRFLYCGAAATLAAVLGYRAVRRSPSALPISFDSPIDISDWVESSSRAAGAVNSLSINGVEYRFHWCPAGTFQMGGNEYTFEPPVHEVTLTRGFWLLETETTQKMWKSVTGSNPSEFEGDNNPVECVSWNDVQEYVEKLNNANGLPSGFKFRLPTEAEWEYACRAGQNYEYSGSDDLDRVGWYGGNSDFHTHEVGQKQSNGWGLYDMSGNVWEWVQDWYGDYPSGTTTDPQGPNSGSRRVDRGGSSGSLRASYCRCAFQCSNYPEDSCGDIGFRLLLESVE